MPKPSAVPSGLSAQNVICEFSYQHMLLTHLWRVCVCVYAHARVIHVRVLFYEQMCLPRLECRATAYLNEALLLIDYHI